MAVPFDTSHSHNIRMDLTDFSNLWLWLLLYHTIVTRCSDLQPKHLSWKGSRLSESSSLQSADKLDYLSQPSPVRPVVGLHSQFSTDQ